eukprot:CAMPEP_0177291596 /NCGR_PEP_ID=MMETSP0367-20130122/76343_1 /TAXON_ID=447022 ORGANISM="Scrippsiella hangoei-like, Strain SHHI-4" /NCGR_SAMPLE_ID=MMETSP0367 /ASSEMBLY_ACC=CAM_ASM_000362 /LENGTH=123 /DNA_ID=CAMNT_0018749125 /DNA_START=331 /DNA_END=699 /DNA_ORIENTATION=-
MKASPVPTKAAAGTSRANFASSTANIARQAEPQPLKVPSAWLVSRCAFCSAPAPARREKLAASGQNCNAWNAASALGKSSVVPVRKELRPVEPRCSKLEEVPQDGVTEDLLPDLLRIKAAEAR